MKRILVLAIAVALVLSMVGSVWTGQSGYGSEMCKELEYRMKQLKDGLIVLKEARAGTLKEIANAEKELKIALAIEARRSVIKRIREHLKSLGRRLQGINRTIVKEMREWMRLQAAYNRYCR